MKNQQENLEVNLRWQPNRPHDPDGPGLATLTMMDSKLVLRLESLEQASGFYRFTEAAIRLAFLTGRMSMVKLLQHELEKQVELSPSDVSKRVENGHGLPRALDVDAGSVNG